MEQFISLQIKTTQKKKRKLPQIVKEKITLTVYTETEFFANRTLKLPTIKNK